MTLQKYVCAENGGGSNVTVSRDIPSAWETFRVRFSLWKFHIFLDLFWDLMCLFWDLMCHSWHAWCNFWSLDVYSWQIWVGLGAETWGWIVPIFISGCLIRCYCNQHCFHSENFSAVERNRIQLVFIFSSTYLVGGIMLEGRGVGWPRRIWCNHADFLSILRASLIHWMCLFINRVWLKCSLNQ